MHLRTCIFLLVTTFLSLLLPPRTFGQVPAGQQNVSPPQPSDYEQLVGYWTTETGWHSELQLRNNLASQDLTVVPALRSADGMETQLSAITIKPQEVKSVDIEAAIPETASQLIGAYGSIILRYRSLSTHNLYAVLMVHNIGHPIVFHIDATAERQNYDAASREGIWWLPNDTADGFLILANQGNNVLQIVLSLYDATGKESKQNVLVGPRETNRYSIRKLVQAAGLTGSYGGIKLYAPAHASSLESLHFIFDQKVGFSALLKMFDHDPNAKLVEWDFAQTSIWTLRAPMLALAHPDTALAFPIDVTLQPQLLIHNTTGKIVTAALRFSWRDDSTTGKAPGPPLQLLPYETRRVDVGAFQDGKILPVNARWTSVTLTTNANPDEVMAVATSYNASLQFGAQTPFSDQLSFAWEGGRWEYDPQHNSIISAGNGGTKPTHTGFTIFYNQGTERYALEQTLQPDEQMWIDMGKLIRERVPDKDGNVLPTDLTSGSYEFRDLTDPSGGTLFEGKVVYERTYGHVTYGCAECCAITDLHLGSDPLDIDLGFTAPNSVWGTNCNGSIVDVSSRFSSDWSTANTAIATVDTNGTHTGRSAGATTTTVFGYLPTPAGLKCPNQKQTVSGNDNVMQVPTADRIVSTQSSFAETSATSPACPTGQAGWYRQVEKIVTDQKGADIVVQGQNLTEVLSYTRNDFGLGTPATDKTATNSSGNYVDKLFLCTPACLKPNSEEADLTQKISDVFPTNGVTYNLKPNAFVYTCKGITINGN
jgi:hypothetical protein